MADYPYSNETTQTERKAIVKNDSYFSRQQNTVDDSGGRFTKLTPTNVTGSTPVPEYPKQTTNSPWANDVLGPEPPLDTDISLMQPNGTPAEVEKSIQANSPSSSSATSEEEGIFSSEADLVGSPIKRRGF